MLELKGLVIKWIVNIQNTFSKVLSMNSDLTCLRMVNHLSINNEGSKKININKYRQIINKFTATESDGSYFALSINKSAI